MPDGISKSAFSDESGNSSQISDNDYVVDTFQELVGHSLSGILVHRNHRVIYVNEAWACIYGMSREQAMQLESIDGLMHPDDRDRVAGYFYQRQRGEAVPEVYDFRIIRADGEVRTLQMYAFLIDWKGEVACCATVIDVTLERERELASAENIAQAEREIAVITQAVLQSSDGLLICDANLPDYPIVFVNHSFIDMSGYSEVELIGRSCKMLQGADTCQETLSRMRRCIREGIRFDGTVLNYHKNGTVFWNRLSIAPVKSEDGELTHYVGTQRDISAQVELNEELLLTRRALDQASDRIGVVDLDFKYVYANEALCERFGQSRDSLIGKSIPELIGAESFNDQVSSFLSKARRGEVVNTAVTLPNADGSLELIEYSAAPHYAENDEIVGVTMVSRDKTEESEARIALIENEHRFRDFASLGAEIFFEANESGELIWMSDGMNDWLSENRPDDPEPNIRTMLGDGLSREDSIELNERIDAGQPFRLEYQSAPGVEGVHAMEFRGHAYRFESGEQIYRGIGRDLTEQRRAEEQLAWQATHDEMTGLINRREFSRSLRERLANDNDSQTHSLMFLDLDHLKVVNDTCGHAAGDRLLVQLTEFLQSHVEVVDSILARVGGDEFALFVSGLSEEEAEKLAHTIVREASNVQLNLTGRVFNISLSIGVVHLSGTGRSLEESLACADVACYQAKRLGRNQAAVYRDNDEGLLRQRRVNRMEAEIRTALEQQKFELHLQPIVSLSKSDPVVVKYEVLVRMRDANNNLVLPNEFIDSAEAYGLITAVDRWVTRSAIRLVKDMTCDCSLSINLSGNSFAEPDLAREIGRDLQRYGVDGSRLCFEITETAAIRRRDSAVSLIGALHDLGCRVSLDDFGSGLSSLRYLKDFDIDEIKIDGSFITNLNNSRHDQVVVNAIVDIARNFELTVVAEKIEDAATYELLRRIGVGYGQGYFFGAPTMATEIVAGFKAEMPFIEDRKLA